MAGQRRLDSFAALVATAVEDGVPGHVIETGVWRGGASFVAAKTLELLGARAAGRRTYLADSFQGIPDQRRYGTSRFGGVNLSRQERFAHKFDIMNNNSVDRVRRDAERLGLDMARLSFVVGYFNSSLPELLAAEPEIGFAAVRLDGDTFLSTYEAIELLYPRLSPGGFLIVDDYLDWPGCRDAIDRYRERHAIREPITLVPHDESSEAVRGVYWRKAPAAGQLNCAQGGEGRLRPRGWLEHHVMTNGQGTTKQVTKRHKPIGATRAADKFDATIC